MARIINILRNGKAQEEIEVKGWIRTKRELKEFSFIEVNDGSSLGNLQAVLNSDLPNYQDIIKRLNTGVSVRIKGILVDSPAKGQKVELQAQEVIIFGDCDPETYPLQKKRHSFEFLRTIGHLRGRTNTIGAVMRVRNACANAIHQFFQSKGFLWVHTPIITASDCEGAGELFTVTNLSLEKIIQDKKDEINYENDFFGRQAYLTVSGQLEAEIMAMSFQNVYTFGPTFRAENSNTSRHLAEFWMVEPEIAFCDLEGDQNLAEEFLKYVFKYVLDHCPEDMAFFNQRINQNVLINAENIINNEFARIDRKSVV